ncbi:MAG: hypothetical protein ACRDZU_12895 [Acidimicrobiales bacterium]
MTGPQHRGRWRPRLRTLTTGLTLTLLVSAAYVFVLRPLSTDEGGLLASLIATLLVVAVYPVALRTAHRWVEHLVYGERADAMEDLQRFASRGGGLDARSLPARVTEAAGRLVDARCAELRLSLPGGDFLEEVWPAGSLTDELDLVVQVRHEGQVIGTLGVAKRPADPISPADEQLIRRLAQATSVALDNARLTLELRAQVHEIEHVAQDLQVSSARIVVAAEGQQRRVERAIRKEVEVPLRATLARVRSAWTIGSSDADHARELLREAGIGASDALNALRDVAHGIFPPLLLTDGLVIALRSRARREGWSLDIDSSGFDDSTLDVDQRATAYFALSELVRAAFRAPRDDWVLLELALRGDELVATLDDQTVCAAVTAAASGSEDSDLARAVERVGVFGGRITASGGPGAPLRMVLPLVAEPV